MPRPPLIPASIAAWIGVMVLAAPGYAQSPWSFEIEGRGCPSVTSDAGPVLYGVMPEGTWHLGGSSLTFHSNGPSWRARSGGEFLAPSVAATDLQAGDDEIVGPVALPFAFSYPGGAGTTSAIDISPNGRVYLEAGTNSFETGWDADRILPNFLGATPSVCPLGVDLNGAGGRVLFEAQVIGGEEVATVTWDSVPEYPSDGSNTFQCQLWSSGRVVFAYLGISVQDSLNEALVGVSAGGGAIDPGPSPLTVPLRLSVAGTPVLGEDFTLLVSGVPLAATMGVLGVSAERPGAPRPTFWGTLPSCSFQIGQPVLRAPIGLSPPFGTVTMNASALAALTGLDAQLQAFVIDPSQTVPNPMLMSARGALTIGVPSDLEFVAEGANSYTGSAEAGGFFELRSGPVATHPNIVRLEVSSVGLPLHFDTCGNAGVGAQGHFSDGNGVLPESKNAFNGTDTTVGLSYGTPGQAVSTDGTGTTGWVGSVPLGSSATRFRTLMFEFTDFNAGETFGFDCDTDGSGDHWAGAQLFAVTVTFANGTQATTTLQPITDELAKGVLIP